MTWKRTLFAAAVFVIALMALFADVQLGNRRVYQAVNEASLAPGINRGEVIEIKLTNASGELLLVREPGGWRMKKPSDAAADPETVEQLLTNVTGARKRNELPARNLAEYGLAAPQATLTLKTETGKTFEVQLGSESTYTSQVFARYPEGRTVFTVGEQVRGVMLRPVAELRFSRLVDVDVGKIEAYDTVQVKRKDSQLTLKQEGGRWRITEPVQTPAESGIVMDYLRKLGLLRASGFLGEQDTKPVNLRTALQSLSQPAMILTIKRGNESVGLAVANAGTTSEPIYVSQRTGGGEVMLIQRPTLEAIDEDESFFRSRTIFSLKSSDVRLLSVEIGRGRTDLVKNDQGLWTFVGDPKRRVDQDQVNRRLEALVRAKIRSYVDTNPRDLTIYDLAPVPRFRFTLQDAAKQHTEVLEAGRSEPGQTGICYAKRGDDKAVFNMDLASDFIMSPDLLADRHFLRVNPRDVEGFKIKDGDLEFAFRKQGGVWQVLKPLQTVYMAASNPKVDRFLGLLGTIQYDRDYAGEGQTVISPKDDAHLAVSITGGDGAEMMRFDVGKKLPKASFVRTGDGRTYEVGAQSITVLESVVKSLEQ